MCIFFVLIDHMNRIGVSIDQITTNQLNRLLVKCFILFPKWKNSFYFSVNRILSFFLNLVFFPCRWRLITIKYLPKKNKQLQFRIVETVSRQDRDRLDNIPFGGFPKVEKHKLPARKKSYFLDFYFEHTICEHLEYIL